MAEEMTAIVMGVHVLDVLVRPVEEIPEGQGGQLVEQIRITAAGSAGGAALVLAELGAPARRPGAGGAGASAGILAAGDPGLLEWVAPALPELDYLLPNDEQVLGFTGASDVADGCRALVERGVGCVAATCGADGVLIVDGEGVEEVPAFDIEVVDTTGCGDAFSAGFLRGLSLWRDHSEAATLGCAAAALVAQGLGTDHGDYDLARVDGFASE